MNQTNLEVSVINEENYKIPNGFVSLIHSILTHENESLDKIVTITFIDEDEMKQLFSKYYGYTHSTDVLSFEAGEVDPESGKEILGDIVICYTFVENQSLTLGNDLFEEIKLLVVHGMLHLLGYDHMTEDQKSVMWKSQNEILTVNRIRLNQLPE